MKSRILKIVSYILVIISFIYIIRALVGMSMEMLFSVLTPFRIFLFLMMAIIYSLNTFFYALAWRRLLFIFSRRKIPAKKVINLYLKSNIAKYLPGNVFHFAGRHILVSEDGISHTHMLFSNLAEILLLIITSSVIIFFGIVTGAVIIPSAVTGLISLKFIITASLIALTVLLITVLVILKRREYERLAAFIRLFNRGNIREALAASVLYSTMFIITGFILYFIFIMIKEGDFSIYSLYQVIFVFTLSWVLGYIVPGAPGGVGIREAVLIIMLSPVLDSQSAALGALILRVITIIGDVISFAISNIRFLNYREQSKV